MSNHTLLTKRPLQINPSPGFSTYLAMRWYLKGTKMVMPALLPSMVFCWIAGTTSESGIGTPAASSRRRVSISSLLPKTRSLRPLKSASVRIGVEVA